jgi:integrase/recombinase XerD
MSDTPLHLPAVVPGSPSEPEPASNALPAVVGNASPVRPEAEFSACFLAVPAAITRAGNGARFAYEEFFLGLHRNPHTRLAYARAVSQFCDWLDRRGVPLERATPGLIGHYFDTRSAAVPTQKLHLAALRGFFDHLVTRHVLVLNPAATVRGPRYSVVEGKTPEIGREQARALLDSVPSSDPLGLRDRAILGVLAYTAARAGAVAKLRRGDLVHDGTQSLLRFLDKGGKAREIPVRHDLERMLGDYLLALDGAAKDSPLFRSAAGRTGRWTENPITGVDIWRMVKRRLAGAGLPNRLSPHSFRVAVITDLLEQGIDPNEVQYLAGHADARTTRLYDRRQRRVTRNIVERISI